jgi:hypothetical protein
LLSCAFCVCWPDFVMAIGSPKLKVQAAFKFTIT